MIEIMCTFLISGNDVISLESRPLNFRVVIHTYSLRPQMYFQSSLTQVLNPLIQKQIKSKHPDEYLTIDKGVRCHIERISYIGYYLILIYIYYLYTCIYNISI